VIFDMPYLLMGSPNVYLSSRSSTTDGVISFKLAPIYVKLIVNQISQINLFTMHAKLSQEKNVTLGIIVSLIAYFFVALIGVFQKSISVSTPLVVTLFFQSMISLALIIPWALKDGVSIKHKDQVFTYVIRIFSGLACYAALFYIIRYMPISEGLLFQYTSSLWIPFIALVWLKVRMPTRLWSSILIGFVGVIFLLEPQARVMDWVLFIAISSGILQAISVVAIRKLLVTEPISRILFYYFLIGTIVTFPYARHSLLSLSLHDVIFLVAVGLTTFAAQYIIALSLRYAKASTLAPTCYFSILFAGVFDWLIWHVHPRFTVMIGMALVIFSGLLLIYLTKPSIIHKPSGFAQEDSNT